MRLTTLLSSRLIQILISYLLVGVCNTTICLSVMYLGSRWGMGYLSYTVMGYAVGIIGSFFMNLRYTFRAKGALLTRLLLFILINLSNLCIVEGIEYVLIERYLVVEWIAVMLGMGWYIVTGFLLNRYIVYKQRVRVR